jgi:predicted DNA-binding WGR domain protein
VDWILLKAWGRIGTPLGGMKQSLYPSYEEAIQELNQLKKQRQQRGYQLIYQ